MDKKIKIAVFTISTRSSRGEREDKSGAELCKLVEKYLGEIVQYKIISDHRKQISDALIEASECLKADIIFTTGGTGLSPTDVTPEATEDVIDRKVPGIAEYIRAKSLEKTKMAVLSRGTSGIRNNSLIVNMPGSPKAVQECFYFIKDILPHALEVLSGKTLDCGSQDL